jgi:hypothetical protein
MVDSSVVDALVDGGPFRWSVGGIDELLQVVGVNDLLQVFWRYADRGGKYAE